MKICPNIWAVGTLSSDSRFAYLQLAMAASDDREVGAEFDRAFVRRAAERSGRSSRSLFWHLKALTREGLILRTVDGDWSFCVLEKNTRWLTCGIPRWWGSAELVRIRPLGLDESGPRRVPVSPRLRAAVLERHGLICGICGDEITGGVLHIDHIHPVARGGATELDNLQPAHARCNLSKGARVAA